MPYLIRKVRNKECYEVINANTRHIHSKCTTREKAKFQLRLLYGIKNGMNNKKQKSSKK